MRPSISDERTEQCSLSAAFDALSADQPESPASSDGQSQLVRIVLASQQKQQVHSPDARQAITDALRARQKAWDRSGNKHGIRCAMDCREREQRALQAIREWLAQCTGDARQRRLAMDECEDADRERSRRVIAGVYRAQHSAAEQRRSAQTAQSKAVADLAAQQSAMAERMLREAKHERSVIAASRVRTNQASHASVSAASNGHAMQLISQALTRRRREHDQRAQTTRSVRQCTQERRESAAQRGSGCHGGAPVLRL